uniref:Uncharacterized protein n=1 Tax=Anguilla anguilla TaxID=7936 RepID=A0A0E9WNU8_ANGAN
MSVSQEFPFISFRIVVPLPHSLQNSITLHRSKWHLARDFPVFFRQREIGMSFLKYYLLNLHYK